MSHRYQRRRELPNSHHERDGAAVCAFCGKLAFTSRKSAKRAFARMHPGSKVRFYRCGQWWHATGQDAEEAARWREHDAQRAAG